MTRASDTSRPPPVATATGVSGVGVRKPQEGRGFRLQGGPEALARWSLRPGLAMGLAMASGGCLVTSVPDYQDPQQTAPFLVPESAFPDIKQVIALPFDSSTKYPSQEFRVEVRSEDARQKVQFRLY